MMVSCILTSYNRPSFVRQALRSVEQQTHRDFELIVMDESDPGILDITQVIEEFSFPTLKLNVCKVSAEERAKGHRLATTINHALPWASGDLICYLADDDYFYKDWFEEAAKFFEERPEVENAFGSLTYSASRHMDFSQAGSARFFEKPVSDPHGKLDHAMVVHRRQDPPVLWPLWPGSEIEPDGYFFESLVKRSAFHPIHASAVVKRIHQKCFQQVMGRSSLEGIRE